MIYIVAALAGEMIFLRRGGPAQIGHLRAIPPSMIWNIFLALLAYDFAIALVTARRAWIRVITGLLAFLFYPNTFYMITDAKHVGDWFPDPRLTFLHAPETVAFVLLLVSILFGTFLGMAAMRHVLNRFLSRSWLKALFALIMSFLSSVAIYAGRINSLRFNSWDIFVRPLATLKGLVAVIAPDNAIFLISFTFYQCFMIGLVYWLVHIEPSQKGEKNENDD